MCEIATGANDSVYQIWVDNTDETRNRILLEGEQEQKENILLEQHRFNKEYLEAAKIAFDGNYSQTLMQIIREMIGGLVDNRIVELDEEGVIIEEECMIDEGKVATDVREFVSYACGQDINRLLMFVLNMNSTVKHFKSANALFV